MCLTILSNKVRVRHNPKLNNKANEEFKLIALKEYSKYIINKQISFIKLDILI